MTPLFGQPLEQGGPLYSLQFEAFWEVSSKRGSKFAAWKAWGKIPDHTLLHVERITHAQQEWQQSEQWQAGIIPHVSTWLNRRGWEEIVPRPAHVHTKMCREFGFCPLEREQS